MDMHAHVFECGMARLVVKYGHQKTCHNDIGLYSQIAYTIPNTMLIRIRLMYVIV